MHEYSVVQALLDQVAAQAAQRSATTVTRVRVRLGALSGVDPDLFATAFEMARQTSPVCAQASMQIVEVPTRWACPTCKTEIPVGAKLWCSDCDRPARLAGGDEIILEQIEMEVNDVH